MAASSGSVISRITHSLSKIIKAPWRLTGVASSTEFLESVKEAGEYRALAPASYPKKPSVPHAQPENVYNIMYYNRESRGASVERKVAVVDPTDASTAVSASTDLPPTPGKFYVLGKPVHLLDCPGDGYQR
eukprot:TRINITY_DN10618_c0_g1_i1.p1 TRINITY_DN10618_c0_g1~~TRINITY_DN10618_c0_g1_i1.p1  ORF type:complete len:153 (-),score=25.18 TRINITY_DN10618_c0_g1_i1:664-1056(-)